MNTRLHKRIKIISLILIAISLGLIVISVLKGKVDMLPLENTVAGMFIFSFFTNYFIGIRDKMDKNYMTLFKWIIRGSIILAVLMILPYIFFGEKWLILAVFSSVFSSIFLIMIVLRLFIYNPDSLRGTITAMALIIIGIFFKHQHWPGSGVILTIFCTIMAYGTFATGVASLFWASKNRFLKYVSFFGGSLLAFAFLGLAFKMQHWPGAGIFMYIAELPMVLFTIIFLLMLPSSGYFSWTRTEKRILARLIIPSVFCLLLMSAVYVFPKAQKLLFGGGGQPPWSFDMYQYTPENKNGLEPEFK
jgi:hypothetical protein